MQYKPFTITTRCLDMPPVVPSRMEVISQSAILHASSCRLPSCRGPLKERLPKELGLKKVVEALTKMLMRKWNMPWSYIFYWLLIYKRVWENVVSCLVCMLANREEQIDRVQGTKVTRLTSSEPCGQEGCYYIDFDTSECCAVARVEQIIWSI